LHAESLGGTYLDEKVLIKILALRVFLVLVLNSTSLNQIDALQPRNSLDYRNQPEPKPTHLIKASHVTP
jgi:hypothetical protein